MGASSTKEEGTKERKEAEAELGPASNGGSADESGGAAAAPPTTEEPAVASRPIDIPKGQQPGMATAWVGSTHSPPEDYGEGLLEVGSLSHAIPPLDAGTAVKGADSGGDGDGGEADEVDGSLKRFTFRWTGEAETVAVAGSFNNWAGIPLRCVGHREYEITLDLKPIAHHYKYIVDGKWQHDPLAPVVASGMGSLNNLLNVSTVGDAHDPEGSFEDFGASVSAAPFGRSTPPGEYSQNIPLFDEADAPPLLPPHLKEATLNSEPLRNDPSELPVPNHVVLDHLYAQSVKDSVLVLGATQRYRRKYITTVLHKPI
mmetsp:Transcript_11830/g.30395  ORF Transcript_11830/g.30395 Transcript_11830/m.30395 type:complete len:315 (+) Transcript_11830:71-1015(+)